MSLISHFENQRELDILVKICIDRRPNMDWQSWMHKAEDRRKVAKQPPQVFVQSHSQAGETPTRLRARVSRFNRERVKLLHVDAGNRMRALDYPKEVLDAFSIVLRELVLNGLEHGCVSDTDQITMESDS